MIAIDCMEDLEDVFLAVVDGNRHLWHLFSDSRFCALEHRLLQSLDISLEKRQPPMRKQAVHALDGDFRIAAVAHGRCPRAIRSEPRDAVRRTDAVRIAGHIMQLFRRLAQLFVVRLVRFESDDFLIFSVHVLCKCFDRIADIRSEV